MKIAVLAALGTATALPAAALLTQPSADHDFWMKEMASKAAASGAELGDAKSAFEELQDAVAEGGTDNKAPPAPGPSTTPHMPGMQHGPHPTTAAPLKPIMVNGLASLAAVSSGVDLSSLVSSRRNPKSAKPDAVGAFRFLCEPSHLAYADPVVFPGDKSGKSHLHLFFGNTAVNADSDYRSLRKTGDSTCLNEGNRSAYWEPALIQTNSAGKDEVVMPEHLNIYYKRRPASDGHYTRTDVSPKNYPVNIPRGLRYVFGYPTQEPKFKCTGRGPNGKWVDDRWTRDMTEALARCPVGAKLDVVVNSPPCWNGKDLDSADHRSHMAHTVSNRHTGHKSRCPASHPYEMATFTLQSIFKILPTDRPRSWRFSSDMMKPGAKPGSTFHADWFGAWEDRIADTWQEWCINKRLNCSSGDLGNGSGLKTNSLYERLKKEPAKRVPVSTI